MRRLITALLLACLPLLACATASAPSAYCVVAAPLGLTASALRSALDLAVRSAVEGQGVLTGYVASGQRAANFPRLQFRLTAEVVDFSDIPSSSLQVVPAEPLDPIIGELVDDLARYRSASGGPPDMLAAIDLCARSLAGHTGERTIVIVGSGVAPPSLTNEDGSPRPDDRTPSELADVVPAPLRVRMLGLSAVDTGARTRRDPRDVTPGDVEAWEAACRSMKDRCVVG